MDWSLSERLVKCKGFGWRLGMRATTEDGSHLRLVGHCLHDLWFDELAEEMIAYDAVDPLPDLNDPATLGCVMQMVWETWFEAIYMEPQTEGGWLAIRPNGAVIHRTPAPYAETLVIALEAAP